MSNFNKRILTILLAICTVIYAVLADKYNLPHSVSNIIFSMFSNDDIDIDPNMYDSTVS